MSGYDYDARHMGNGGKAKIYWSSDCGHEGEMMTSAVALAPLVRAARANHDMRFPACDQVDIERVETEEERKQRLHPRPTVGYWRGEVNG